MTPVNVLKNNAVILELVSEFMNSCSDAITKEMVEETSKGCGVGKEEAFKILLSGSLDIYSDRALREYINLGVKMLDAEVYRNDAYYRTVNLDKVNGTSWTLERMKYKPFELFCRNDLKKLPDGRIIPQLGFFDEEYEYPCILQNGREWMLITPNEIETMKKPVQKAFGKVLTFGLGLGYFAFMVSEKADVESVTVVEIDKEVTELFIKHILPQFPHKEKIEIINADAIFYASDMKISANKKYDFVFADIWHDASDGLGIYEILKGLERKDTVYSYWIEDTLKCYL